MIPSRLKVGDKIGIISPSAPITDDLKEQYKNGIKFLEELEFEIILGKYIFSTSLGISASPKKKAEDISNMFKDISIKAIICSQGGLNANSCLPYLNWDIIEQNPKIFLGISDITALLNPIFQYTGLVTFHGNDLIFGFGNNPSDYDKQEFINCLVEGRIGKIPSNGERTSIREGTVTGKLLGGNLHSLLRLAGTPYFPDFRESILFLEAMDISPVFCDAFFNQLKQIGIFDQIKGVIIGYIYGLQEQIPENIQMEEILFRVTEEYDFPILKVNDFGHNCSNTILPIGCSIELNTRKKEISIIEQYVK